MKTCSRILKSLTLALLLSHATGCQDIVVRNLAAGLRDGLVTTVTGLIEETMNAHFGLEEEEENEESGDDLFVRP